jgi:hypothetical protein
MKKFVYQERKPETIINRSQGGGDFDTYLKRGVQTFKPKAGKHKIRILPPTWDNADHHGLDIWVNYSVGPDRGSYLSLNKMKKAKDPIFEEYAKAKADGRDDDAKNLAAKKRILVYVIDRKQEDAGPLLWAMPASFDKDLCLLCRDPDTNETLKIDHPDEGFDVTFTRDGDGQFTKYTGIQIARNPSPISEDEEQMGGWLDFIISNPVTEQLNFYSYEHIKRAFTGVADTEEQPVVRKASAPVSRQLTKEVDDEDEVEAEAEVVEEKPAAKNSLADRLASRRAR